LSAPFIAAAFRVEKTTSRRVAVFIKECKRHYQLIYFGAALLKGLHIYLQLPRFNLVLQIIIDFDGLRGWWGVAVDVIGLPRRETIDVKDRMLTH